MLWHTYDYPQLSAVSHIFSYLCHVEYFTGSLLDSLTLQNIWTLVHYIGHYKQNG